MIITMSDSSLTDHDIVHEGFYSITGTPAQRAGRVLYERAHLPVLEFYTVLLAPRPINLNLKGPGAPSPTAH